MVTFLQIVQDYQNKDIWCVSSIARLAPGYEFVIVCSSEQEAQSVIVDISNGHLKYPTVDDSGFEEVTSLYPHLKGLTKVFRRI